MQIDMSVSVINTDKLGLLPYVMLVVLHSGQAHTDYITCPLAPT